jgi:carbonic anhydrase
MDIVFRFDPHAPLTAKRPKNNKEAIEYLGKGSDRFSQRIQHYQKLSSGGEKREPWIVNVDPISLGMPIVEGLAPAHNPFALVLGCSDARVPIELVMDCSANDLFVVRVAGNVLGLECLGSVDYAATALRSGLQSVIVLGHTGCGAVTAAVDIYLSPAEFSNIAFTHAVRSMLDRVAVAVHGSARALERVGGSKVSKRKNYRELLISVATYMNAAVTAFDLQREVNAVSQGLRVSYGVYDMAWARVGSLPLSGIKDFASTPHFATAPTKPSDFIDSSDLVIERLLRESK